MSEQGFINALTARCATNVAIKNHPGAWSVEFRRNGETHRHAFIKPIGMVEAAPILAAL